MYEIKTEDVYEDFNRNKEMFDFSSYLAKSKYMIIQTNYSLEKWKTKPKLLWLKDLFGCCHKCTDSS